MFQIFPKMKLPSLLPLARTKKTFHEDPLLTFRVMLIRNSKSLKNMAFENSRFICMLRLWNKLIKMEPNRLPKLVISGTLTAQNQVGQKLKGSMWRENIFLEKSPVDSMYTLWVKTFIKIALSHSVFEIYKIFYFHR